MSGHLTPMGFSQWEDAVAKYASNLLRVMRQNEPELFETKSSSSGKLGLGNWFGNGEDDFENSYDSGDGFDETIWLVPFLVVSPLVTRKGCFVKDPFKKLPLVRKTRKIRTVVRIVPPLKKIRAPKIDERLLVEFQIERDYMI